VNRALDIHLSGNPIARVVEEGTTLRLTYTDQTVDRFGVGGLALSMALPVDDRPYRGPAVERWVEGTLPEGEARTVLEERFSVRRGDTMGLVGAIGADCAGAVSFLPPDEPFDDGTTPTLLTDQQLAGLVQDLPTVPLGADLGVPVSLAGLQAKLPLRLTEDGWTRPTRTAPSTHILKPAPDGRLAGLVVSEAFCLRLAAAAGVRAAEVALIDIAGRMTLVVTRFDRAPGPDGFPVRLHQEDGCQALGEPVTGRAKYQAQTGAGPSYERLARLLVSYSSDVDAELADLARTMTTTIAIGNTDAHARNHGFLLGAGVRLAPLYDAATTVNYATFPGLGLHVAGEHRLDMVSRPLLELEAASWGLPRKTAADVVGSTLERLRAALSDVAAEFREESLERDVAEVGRRLERLLV
jgi:serine/threonine-protein kinase HipA